MFRFTIRDVLWLTVVVGALAAWGVDHWRLEQKAGVFQSWNHVLAKELEVHDQFVRFLPTGMFIDTTWDDGQPTWHPITPGAPFPLD